MIHRVRIVAAIMFLCLALSVRAGETGVTIERPLPMPASDRDRLARNIVDHDFENRHDLDTGFLDPESADFNLDSWPDFWEPIRAIGYPEYLINTVSIVPDTTGQIPGAYRDHANRVLRIGFDGTRVGVRTRVPTPINPELAYELSLKSIDTDLRGARIRAGIDWMRIEPTAALVLRSDDIPDIPTGQIDWPVLPWRMLVSDPPPSANAARLYIVLERLPDAVGGTYHGEARFDEVRLRAHPKILVDAPKSSTGGSRIIPVRYAGLFDNIPDPANPGYFRGKRYSRRVEVTDVFNRTVDLGLGSRSEVKADDTGASVEEIVFPPERYGVYYFNIRLYDADQRLSTDVVRAVAVMRPNEAEQGVLVRSGSPAFGVRAGSVPQQVLEKPGLLQTMLARMGARQAKIIPWRDSYPGPGADNAYQGLVADEARLLRSSGISVTGVVKPPSGLFGALNLASALTEKPAELTQMLEEAGRRLGLFMDAWQWGDDDDGSLEGFPNTPGMEQASASLSEFAGGLPVVWNRPLMNDRGGTFPQKPTVTNAFFPSAQPPDLLWQRAAPVFPWLYEPFHQERGRIYPPRRLSRLAPAPAGDAIEERARSETRTGSWISLDPVSAHPHEPNAAAERVQLEQFLVRAVYAAALRPDIVVMGDLFDPQGGFVRRAGDGIESLETAARPILLAAGTVSRLLEGTEYLGNITLLPPYEAHVFRRPGADQTIIALWHNDASELKMLARREIADGPPLQLVDWAGNTGPLPRSIPVGRVPLFITGLPATLALTRMSVRISPDMPVMSSNTRQNQTLEVVNHLTRQAPALFRLRYAARPEDGAMENGWMVSPEELRINLPPVTPQFTPGRLRYAVSPDPNSPVQKASPAAVDKSGLKIAQVAMTVTGSPPADMLLYLPFRLRSDIDVDIEPIRRVDDPHFLTLQLKVRWTPTGAALRRGEVKLIPFFVKHGQMKEAAPFPTTVKATPPDAEGNANAGFESMELRIPRNPRTRTWVGLDEDGGSLFYLADVTDLLAAP